MRRYVVPIFFLFALVTTALYVFLNTTWFLSYIFPGFVERHFPTVEVQSYTVEKQSFKWPSTLILHHAKFSFEQKGAVYEVNAATITIDNMIAFLKTGQEGRIFVKDMGIESDFQVKGLDLQMQLSLQNNMVSYVNGHFRMDSIGLDGYHFNNVAAHIKGKKQQVQVFGIHADGFGGNCQGQLSLEYGQNYNYILWVELLKLKTKELQAINKNFFSGIEGVVDGSVRMLGNSEKLTLFSVQLEMPEGGKVHPGLIKEIVPYISDGEQKEYLSILLENEISLLVDKAVLEMQTSEPKNLTITFNLENEEQNLHLMNSTVVQYNQGLRSILLH